MIEQIDLTPEKTIYPQYNPFTSVSLFNLDNSSSEESTELVLTDEYKDVFEFKTARDWSDFFIDFPESSPLPSPEPHEPKTVYSTICKYFLNGNCTKGGDCLFSHNLDKFPKDKTQTEPVASESEKSLSFVVKKPQQEKFTIESKKQDVFNLDFKKSIHNFIETPKKPLERRTSYKKPTEEPRNDYKRRHLGQSEAKQQELPEEKQRIQTAAIYNGPFVCSSKVQSLILAYETSKALEPILTNFQVISKDQFGCRFLQNLLAKSEKSVFFKVYDKILLHFGSTATNAFGNYLCQKTIDVLSSSELEMLIKKLGSSVLSFALNIHGTRVVQKLVENVSIKQLRLLCTVAVEKNVELLARDVNGNHVLQKILNKLKKDAETFSFIFEELIANFQEIAVHKHGCCVLQRSIDCAPERFRLRMSRLALDRLQLLVQDAYGNYVVQYLIEKNEHGFLLETVHKLRGDISRLAKQKFSSNVLEKVLEFAKDPEREIIVEELLKDNDFLMLVNDPYANYVVQKCVFVGKKELQKLVLERLKKEHKNMKENSIGMKVCSKLLKRFSYA